MARKLGDGCGWDRMWASVVLRVEGGRVIGTGSRSRLRCLGSGPGGYGCGVGCFISV